MRVKVIVSLMCVGLLSSCASVPKEDANEVDPVGVYSLISVDGGEVPIMAQHGDHEVYVQSGTFTITHDGTCTSEIIFGPNAARTQTRVVHATYTQKGNELHMKWKGAGRTRGDITGDIFTMNNEGMIFSYQKRP